MIALPYLLLHPTTTHGITAHRSSNVICSVVSVKSTLKIFSIFAAFLENTIFNNQMSSVDVSPDPFFEQVCDFCRFFFKISFTKNATILFPIITYMQEFIRKDRRKELLYYVNLIRVCKKVLNQLV